MTDKKAGGLNETPNCSFPLPAVPGPRRAPGRSSARVVYGDGPGNSREVPPAGAGRPAVSLVADLSAGGCAVTQQARWIKELRRRLLLYRGGRCQGVGCSCEKNLEFAHLKPTSVVGRGRGRSDRYLDIKRNPDAYILLCRDCHRRFDRGRNILNEAMSGGGAR